MVDEENDLTPQAMEALYAKTLYVLRESRKAILRQHGVESEADLLERIRCGEASEHPAYEHYLSALIMDQTRNQVREEMLARYRGATADEVPAISVHLMFQERLESEYAHRLAEPVRMAQDALLLSFDTGLMMEVRYFSNTEFSVFWSWGEAEMRLDTAPVHVGLETLPRHFHRDDGAIMEDPLALSGDDAWRDFSRLLDALLVDPLLEQLPKVE